MVIAEFEGVAKANDLQVLPHLGRKEEGKKEMEAAANARKETAVPSPKLMQDAQ